MGAETRVELWYLTTGSVIDHALVATCEALLAPEERARGEAFVFPIHRHEHLVTRALARAVLARHVGGTPGELAFQRTEHGRPELVPPPALRFNLTNTVHLVACAVSPDGAEVGVDAEPLSRAEDVLAVAETVFTAREREALGHVTGEARRRRAVGLWTAKESYMKARGLGLSLEPSSFEILEGRIHPEDRPWTLVELELEGHLVTVCVGTDAKVVVDVHVADLARLLA